MDIFVIILIVMLGLSVYPVYKYAKQRNVPQFIIAYPAAIIFLAAQLHYVWYIVTPTVLLEYKDTSNQIYSNVTTNDKQQEITESKHLPTCTVVLTRSQPMVVLTRETRSLVFRVPCDKLLPEMKTEIANMVIYMKGTKGT